MNVSSLRTLQARHRVAIGAVLRGDKELHPSRVDALLRRGLARRTSGSVEIVPEVAEAYRSMYRILPAKPVRVTTTHRIQ